MLANYLVAERLLLGAPSAAVLRGHPPIPTDRGGGVASLAAAMGFAGFSTASAGALHNSLLAVWQVDPAAAQVLEFLATKPILPARYL